MKLYLCRMTHTLLISYITTMVAFITAFGGITLQCAAIGESVTAGERRQKKVWLAMFCALFMVWLYYFLHIGVPISPVYTGAPFVLALLCVPILLCHAVRVATSPDHRGLPLYHYAVPALYFLTYYIWTPLVPEDIRWEFLHSGTMFTYKVYPGYEAYCHITNSIAWMRGIISLGYGAAAIVMILRYYRGDNPQSGNRRWRNLYLTIVAIPLVNGVFAAIAPGWYGGGMQAVAFASCLIIVQMVIIIGQSFGRNTTLFATFIPEQHETVPQAQENPAPVAQLEPEKPEPPVKPPLTRERFEGYYIKQKRYLDPDIRLTDLLEPLETTRTLFSIFINRTYGVSFSQLTARLRLREMDRLMALPSNRNKTVSSLTIKAGFAREGAYYHTRRSEEKGAAQAGNKTKPGGPKKHKASPGSRTHHKNEPKENN